MPDIETSRKQQPSGCRKGKVPEKTTEEQPEQAKQLFFRMFSSYFRLFERHFTPHPLGPFSGVFQRRAFGTSPDGRKDCKSGAPQQNIS